MACDSVFGVADLARKNSQSSWPPTRSHFTVGQANVLSTTQLRAGMANPLTPTLLSEHWGGKLALAIRSTDFGIMEDVDIVRTDRLSDVVSRRFKIQIRDFADLEKARGRCHVQLIMKDISTVRYQPIHRRSGQSKANRHVSANSVLGGQSDRQSRQTLFREIGNLCSLSQTRNRAGLEGHRLE